MTIKVFVSKENKANFTCPSCGTVREKDVSKFSEVDQAVKLKCRCVCGEVYSAFLERRRHFRKSLELRGTFTREGGREKGYMVVTDLSRSGMKLKVPAKFSFAPGDKLTVSFLLDDKQFSRIEKQVVVRTTGKGFLGVEFLSTDHYDKLGPYLLFHF